MIWKFGLVGALVAFLAGCGTWAPEGSPAYREGWTLGCYTGFTDGGWNWYWGQANQPAQYKNDPEWHAAWLEAYRKCFDRAAFTPGPGIGV